MNEHEHMSKREAVARLLGLSCSRHINERDVTAIQVATRALIKRIFDRERIWKRRHAAETIVPKEIPAAAQAPFADEAMAQGLALVRVQAAIYDRDIWSPAWKKVRAIYLDTHTDSYSRDVKFTVTFFGEGNIIIRQYYQVSCEEAIEAIRTGGPEVAEDAAEAAGEELRERELNAALRPIGAGGDENNNNENNGEGGAE